MAQSTLWTKYHAWLQNTTAPANTIPCLVELMLFWQLKAPQSFVLFEPPASFYVFFLFQSMHSSDFRGQIMCVKWSQLRKKNEYNFLLHPAQCSWLNNCMKMIIASYEWVSSKIGGCSVILTTRSQLYFKVLGIDFFFLHFMKNTATDKCTIKIYFLA